MTVYVWRVDALTLVEEVDCVVNLVGGYGSCGLVCMAHRESECTAAIVKILIVVKKDINWASHHIGEQ